MKLTKRSDGVGRYLKRREQLKPDDCPTEAPPAVTRDVLIRDVPDRVCRQFAHMALDLGVSREAVMLRALTAWAAEHR